MCNMIHAVEGYWYRANCQVKSGLDKLNHRMEDESEIIVPMPINNLTELNSMDAINNRELSWMGHGACRTARTRGWGNSDAWRRIAKLMCAAWTTQWPWGEVLLVSIELPHREEWNDGVRFDGCREITSELKTDRSWLSTKMKMKNLH